MRRHPIPVVAACIVNEDNVSVLLHKKNESHDEKGIKRNPELIGKWEFPGGMMEGKETPQETLKREMVEELNIEVDIDETPIYANTFVFKDKKPYLVLFYRCHTNFPTVPEGCMYTGIFDTLPDNLLPGDGKVFEYLKEFYS